MHADDERRAHFLCGGEALHGVFRHGLHDDGLKRRIDLGVQLARRHRLVLHLLHGNADGVGAVERQLARGGFVQHDAQRIDVARGGEVFALRLLNIGRESCLLAYSRQFPQASPQRLEYFYAFASGGNMELYTVLGEGTQSLLAGVMTPEEFIESIAFVLGE